MRYAMHLTDIASSKTKTGLLTVPSAGAVTIYKCTTLIGLITLVDFTYAVDDVVLWTK